MHDVIIIGGGLAGLVSSTLLARAGLRVALLEQKAYPLHRVCGEYVSNEVRPFLEREGLFPAAYRPSEIRHFELSAPSGHTAQMPLDLGAFGISRYAFDAFLAGAARAAGVAVEERCAVREAAFDGQDFTLTSQDGRTWQAPVVVGAFGKRSRLDKALDRPFMQEDSPYIGVKYHIHLDYPPDRVALHNFPGGYCGLNRVEGDTYNLCYLGRRDQLRAHGSIPAMEAAILWQNPHLRHIFQTATFLLPQPVVINAISFAPKAPVEAHLLMCGDAAGLITPLCGNGMAMAIHAATLVTGSILRYGRPGTLDRPRLEAHYRQGWNQYFRRRLWVGRHIQRLFGAPRLSQFAVGTVRHLPPLAQWLMRQTHGEVF